MSQRRKARWRCTVYFRAPGNTPIAQPPGCEPRYTAEGDSRKSAIAAANALVPEGCQGPGIGSYGHPNVRRIQ